MGPNRASLACLTMPFLSLSFAFLAANVVASTVAQEPLVSPTNRDWDTLRNAVGQRLFQGVPFAHPCFTEGFNSTACILVRSGYLDEGELFNLCVMFTLSYDLRRCTFGCARRLHTNTVGNVPDV